ncbi:hypothetical protein MED01_002400 [Micromonospora sp. MED01]|uniref:hypothetical protein n=1 Tax=Micromonospora alfalfae TaxID=2911212 RepID=UPI001EE8102F|nr:hypothetical protein [Micromonospora alfalfae]MCG5464235.1 hypothetical protein [Micromonospora alfalfae]
MPIPAGGGTPPVIPTGPLYYDPVLSRVRLTADGLLDTEPWTVQRSTDLIRWATVRGGSQLTPVAGTVQVDDYEFAPNVTNHYRVMGPAWWDTFSRTVTGGWGGTWVTSGGTGANYAVPGAVAQHLQTGPGTLLTSLVDVGLTSGTLRVDVNVPVTPTVAPITVWVPVRATGLSDYYVAHLTFGTDGSVKLSIGKRVGGTLTFPVSLVPVGTNNPAFRWQIRVDWQGSTVRALAFQGNFVPDWQATMTDPDITVGTQAGVLTRLETGNTNGAVTITVDSFVVTSPQAAAFTGSIVPDLDTVWLKSIARPFLNRAVVVRDFSDITRRSRAGVFDVKGRTMPVAVTDVRGSRQWTLDVNTYNEQERTDLDSLLAGGDILLVHVPANSGRISAAPGGYVTVGDTRETTLPTAELTNRVFTLPLTEVAAPGPDVVGSTGTWQTVLNTYATWADVMAAHSSWTDLQELIGDGTEVVVS